MFFLSLSTSIEHFVCRLSSGLFNTVCRCCHSRCAIASLVCEQMVTVHWLWRSCILWDAFLQNKNISKQIFQSFLEAGNEAYCHPSYEVFGYLHMHSDFITWLQWSYAESWYSFIVVWCGSVWVLHCPAWAVSSVHSKEYN